MTKIHRDYSMYTVDGYPVRHKRKVPFEPRLKLSLEYRSMMEEIRSIDLKLGSMILSDKDYLFLVNEAYSNNIHWSVKLEGNDLPLEEVKKITRRFTSGEEIERSSGPKQEILNHLYSFLVRDVFELPWNLNTIHTAHRLLMSGVLAEDMMGKIRTEENSIVGSDGFEYFKTCPPEHIEEELRSLVEWVESSPYDPVITAAIFFHEFESIHPFMDGNGRTGRTLFQIMLQELGLKNSKLCMFEQELLKIPNVYYTLLAYTDKPRDGMIDYVPFVMYVAEALLRAYKAAFNTFEEKDMLKELDESSKVLARNSKTVNSFTVSDACSWIPSLGEQTIRKKLVDLEDQGIIEKEGRTRSTRFMFRDPLKNIRERVREEESAKQASVYDFDSNNNSTQRA